MLQRRQFELPDHVAVMVTKCEFERETAAGLDNLWSGDVSTMYDRTHAEFPKQSDCLTSSINLVMRVGEYSENQCRFLLMAAAFATGLPLEASGQNS